MGSLSHAPHGARGSAEFPARLKLETCSSRQVPGRSPTEKPWALLPGTEDEKEQQLSQERNIQKGSIPGKSSLGWQRVGGREVASAGLLPRVPLIKQSPPGNTAPAAFRGRLCWGGGPHLRRNPRGGSLYPLRLHSSVSTTEKQTLPPACWGLWRSPRQLSETEWNKASKQFSLRVLNNIRNEREKRKKKKEKKDTTPWSNVLNVITGQATVIWPSTQVAVNFLVLFIANVLMR